ncbi:MAG: alginate export family protein [Acidobacteriia bacterium]|nr:alginate export family protein [Terriglobia bacterium]
MYRPCALLVPLLAALSDASLFAQASPDQLKIGDVVVSGSLRTRIEAWDWFQGNANNDYTFPGSIFRLNLSQSTKKYDWQLEFALPFLLGLPGDAIATGAQGQLGFGASYFAANKNNTNAALPFAKQGFVRFKGLGGVDGQSLKLGRMEFIDGTEITPANATLAALKRDRIAHRLLGNFAFSDVGRSFDGAQYVLNGRKLNFTFLAARPTRGVFQVDGWGELNINVFYGALTGQIGGTKRASEWRLFGLGYSDYRDNVVKTDNRPLALRRADSGHISIGTYGGHFLHTVDTPAGALDVLFWGALQTGTWGSLVQRSGAFAAETGWQPPVLARVKPWIRGGYDYGSGDKNPNDSTHGTFFQVLPTPRVYARFPFFNMMNNRDVFGELMLRPSKRLTIRTDVHSLRLANSNDLWYSGGGAFQPWTFGYTGRASNGQSGLATLYDASGDFNLNRYFSIGAYYGHAAGKLAVQSIYPDGEDANFGFVELLFKF